MINRIFVGVSVLPFAFGSVKAQRSDADSLMRIKDYLFAIRDAVNSKTLTGRQKTAALDTLVRQGTVQEAKFKKYLLAVKAQDQRAMLQQFHFTVQAAAIYKSDLKQGQFVENAAALGERRYMDNQIAKLVHQIYYYAKRAKMKQ